MKKKKNIYFAHFHLCHTLLLTMVRMGLQCVAGFDRQGSLLGLKKKCFKDNNSPDRQRSEA